MDAILAKLTNKQAQGFANSVGAVFKTAPHLPKDLVQFFVNIMHYLAGLGGLLSLWSGIQSLFLRSSITPFASLIPLRHFNTNYLIVNGVFALISGALLLLAYQPLSTKKLSGWLLLFWVSILGIIAQIATLALGYTNIIGIIVGALISLYLIFELRPYYK